MKETIALLKDGDLMKKLNRLVDLLHEERCGLYLGDDTPDLTVAAVSNYFLERTSPRDNV